ncbi:MAG: M28 family peptidase [Flavobacteriia bacterium]
MRYLFTFFLSAFLSVSLSAQTNLLFTETEAEQIIKGNYDPLLYSSSNPIEQHTDIISFIQNNVRPDSLKSYILKLSEFQNRNTASDTISSSFGIGAARRWGHGMFENFSNNAENRLITSYFQFDLDICGVNRHRNILAVLPGADTSNHEVIIIEGHIDSRCEDECGITCLAEGIEDNASGTALVLELARVMSQCTFQNTIVFMLTVGEEQGLYGADAFAEYCDLNNIPVKAVLNNDVIGGVICGQTSSSPSCPGLNDIDSTQVRIFSYGGFNSSNKQLSRFIKLQYKEELLSMVSVPMLVTIMSGEDRSGRGGDHIPFRLKGFPSCRFTSANEHGDASNVPGYTDRQHTSTDIVGLDTDLDGVIDSFFIDFNYLSRNACINGTGAAIAAIGPKKPDFSIQTIQGPGIIIHVTDQTQYGTYRVGVRSINNDWDSVYTIQGIHDTIFPPETNVYYVSIASVDEQGLESLFSREILIPNSQVSIEEQPDNSKGATIELLQNRPNPFDETTIIGVLINSPVSYKRAEIQIKDLNGKVIERLRIDLNKEINEVFYHHGFGRTGTFLYTLNIDGKDIDTKRMVFAN